MSSNLIRSYMSNNDELEVWKTWLPYWQKKQVSIPKQESTPKSGWFDRQRKRVAEEVSEWPLWMKKAANVPDKSNVDKVLNHFISNLGSLTACIKYEIVRNWKYENVKSLIQEIKEWIEKEDLEFLIKILQEALKYHDKDSD